MPTISNTVTRKFLNSVDLSNLEIETDSGWQPVTTIHKTVPYNVWVIETASGLTLECADTHIVFDENQNEMFIKDIKEGSTKILTKNGAELVVKVLQKDLEENMFDITVNHTDHRFYTNGILSHNTTIINALSYALYGQALTNIKRENLINKINGKGMLVTVEFEKDNLKYRIERGRKPNVLKLYVNDSELKLDEEDDSQGDSRETQKAIEQMLEMSHTMFKHLVALNTYTEPFLSMRAADQREVIEQLLGITLLSEKAEALKSTIKDTKEQITSEEFRITGVKTANENIQKSINSLRLKSNAWDQKKNADIDSFSRAIVQLESVDIDAELGAHNLLKLWTENDTKLRNLNKQKSTLESAVTQAERTLNKYTKELNTLANKTCPACEQDLHDHKHEEMTAKVVENITESKKYLDKVTGDLNKVLSEVSAIGELEHKPNTFYETQEEALGHKNNLNSLEKSLESRIDETNPYDEQIVELENSALQEINWQTINELTKLKDHQEFLHKLLTNKDSFIRKKIIDQNLNYLNKRLSYYIDTLGLPHQVIFQNDLSVEITQLGQDLDFDNLSRGERNRLILSMSFAFRDVWEGLYQNINLLFIDEMVDSGMDGAGVEAALAVLKKMSRDRNKNIYLISHKDELIGRVNNVLKVIKEGGFTSYSNASDYIE
jgi:DNA repair exonuclease SbcCD ATPase subunit